MGTRRRPRPRIVWAAGLILTQLACGGGPADAVEDLGDYAQRRDLVKYRAMFTESSKELLRRRWREDGLSEPAGWLDLMIGYLGRDKEPPDVLGEQLLDERTAVVKVSKELEKQGKRVIQDLRVVKADGAWRIDLGEMVYVEQDLDTGEERKPKAPPKATDEDWGLGGGGDEAKEARENLEDFDLEKL